MANAAVKIAILADAGPAKKALSDLADSSSKSVNKAADSADRYGKSLDGMTDKADASEARILGVKDAVDGVATVMKGPGEQGMAAYLQGWADIASGVANAALPAIQAAGQAFLKTAAGQKIAAAATRVYTAAQWLLNAALSANPIGLVIIAIAALVAIFVVAYKKSETFRNIVNKAFEGIKTVGGKLVGWFKDLPGAIVKAVGNLTGTLPRKGLDLIVGLATGVYKNVAGFVTWWAKLPGNVLRWIGNTALTLARKGLDLVAGLARGVYDNIGGLATWWAKLPASVLRWIGSTASTLARKGLDLIAGLARGVYNNVTGLSDWLSKLPGKAVTWAGNMAGALVQKGKDLIGGLIRGILSKLPDVGGAMGKITDKIGGFLPGSPVKTGPLKKWNNGRAGKLLMGLLASGIVLGGPTVAAAMDDVSGGLNPRVSLAGVSASGAGGDTHVYVTIDGQQLEGRITRVARSEVNATNRQIRRAVASGAPRSF